MYTRFSLYNIQQAKHLYYIKLFYAHESIDCKKKRNIKVFNITDETYFGKYID